MLKRRFLIQGNFLDFFFSSTEKAEYLFQEISCRMSFYFNLCLLCVASIFGSSRPLSFLCLSFNLEGKITYKVSCEAFSVDAVLSQKITMHYSPSYKKHEYWLGEIKTHAKVNIYYWLELVIFVQSSLKVPKFIKEHPYVTFQEQFRKTIKAISWHFGLYGYFILAWPNALCSFANLIPSQDTNLKIMFRLLKSL